MADNRQPARTLEEDWENFRREVVDHSDFSPAVRETLRRVFFSGAMCAFSMVSRAVHRDMEKGRQPGDELTRMMEEVFADVSRFKDRLKAEVKARYDN